MSQPILFIKDDITTQDTLQKMQFKVDVNNECLIDRAIFDHVTVDSSSSKVPGYKPFMINFIPWMKHGEEVYYFIMERQGVQSIYHPLTIPTSYFVSFSDKEEIMCLSRTIIYRLSQFLDNSEAGFEFSPSSYVYPIVLMNALAHPFQVIDPNQTESLDEAITRIQQWLPNVVGLATAFQLTNKDIMVDEFSLNYTLIQKKVTEILNLK